MISSPMLRSFRKWLRESITGTSGIWRIVPEVELVGGTTMHFAPEVYDQAYKPPPWNVYIVNQAGSGCAYGTCVLKDHDENNRIDSAKVFIDPQNSNSTFLQTNLNTGWFAFAASHEVGHTFGLAHNSNVLILAPGSSVMAGPLGNTSGDAYERNTSMPTLCDVLVVAGLYCRFCVETECPEDY